MQKTIALGVLPARYAAGRFPGKMLADLGGKSVIQRTYEQAMKSEKLTEVVVATDHEEIKDHVESFGGNCVLTSDQHQSGTDRCLEAWQKRGRSAKFVVNVQGDEPFINPMQIDKVVELLELPATAIATLAIPIQEAGRLHNAAIVKVVISHSGKALYFSRQPIPFVRDVAPSDWLSQSASPYYQHIGLYGYRSETLEQIGGMVPSALEQTEKLEQLRWLQHDLTIRVGVTEHENFGIDTPEDLAQAALYLQKVRQKKEQP